MEIAPYTTSGKSWKCANFMYTGNVQKYGISVHLLEIYEYLRCSFSSCGGGFKCATLLEGS